MAADNNDKSGDLSSLMSMPPEEGHEATTPAAPEQAPEAVEFESLEELSHSQIENATPDTAPPSSSPPTAFEPLPMEGMTIEASQDTFVNAPLDAPEETTPLVSPMNEEMNAGMDAPKSTTMDAMDTIKHYSETLATPAQVSASFPFTLKIDGMLSPEDAEKLLTVLTRENMGFREVDLEPQLSSGRILIPRISEYAGVLLIQALRGIPAKIYFGPADEIFSTDETRDDSPHAMIDSVTTWNAQDETQSKQNDHSTAENMPVTGSESLPQFSQTESIDTVFTSGLLSTNAVEAAQSNEYERLLEGLLRELKFKAHRRGANGIVSLNVQLTPLTLPTDYRVTITGSAVRGK